MIEENLRTSIIRFEFFAEATGMANQQVLMNIKFVNVVAKVDTDGGRLLD